MTILSRLLRYRWTLSLLLLLVLPFTLRGALHAWRSNANDVLDWLPDNFEATEQLGYFVGLFGSDELLMISWEGCTLDDPRIAALRAEICAPAASASGEVVYYREVFTGPAILDAFRGPPLEMSSHDALQRMAGWIVSADGNTTCLIALVSEAGTMNRHAAVAHVFAAADRVAGLSSQAIHVAGPTIEGVAVDEASQSGLLALNLASFAICLAIMVVCLGSLRAALLVFLIALFNEQLSMALVHYTGCHLDSILLLTANLTFVVTVSIGIHLVNYYRDAMITGNLEDAVARACRAAWTPTFLATLTTALGLVSLTVSRIRPITRFGAYSAASISIGMLVVIVYVALHFQIWPLRRWNAAIQPDKPAEPGPAKRRLVALLTAFQWPILLTAFAVLMGGGLGTLRLRTSVGLNDLLPSRSRVIQDYAWLEDHIGPLVPVEVLIEMPRGDDRQLLAQFRTIRAAHEALQAVDPRDAVISSATFAPEPPRSGGFRQVAQAAVFRKRLMSSQDQLRELGYLTVDSETNYWRITLRTSSSRRSDYGALLAALRRTVVETVHVEGMVAPDRIIVCGGVPLIFQAQQQLLKDLIISYVLSFALIAIALMLVFRSVACGALCIIPNILPSAMVFGLMGWIDMPVELGTILTASAALGISVDDALHFITWFQRRISVGGSAAEAVSFAYRRCALAMIQTTLICSLGLVVFALSPFAPIARFGMCMFVLLLIALLGNLIVLPAILLSPLGRPFLPKPQATRACIFQEDKT